jgi:hypothetical protein
VYWPKLASVWLNQTIDKAIDLACYLTDIKKCTLMIVIFMSLNHRTIRTRYDTRSKIFKFLKYFLSRCSLSQKNLHWALEEKSFRHYFKIAHSVPAGKECPEHRPLCLLQASLPLCVKRMVPDQARWTFFLLTSSREPSSRRPAGGGGCMKGEPSSRRPAGGGCVGINVRCWWTVRIYSESFQESKWIKNFFPQA